MRPIDYIEIEGKRKRIGLYIDLDKKLFQTSVLIAPLEGFVDVISFELAEEVANRHLTVFTTKMSLSKDSLDKTKAFGVSISGEPKDYYLENRVVEGRKEEYEIAKRDLQDARMDSMV
ncbi:MAG: hypothetical protein KAQ64_03610 [Candidatus Pacebacteria bacterium]|nr:hypothetical protein [Candidatus Paceibacterota bacterium]